MKLYLHLERLVYRHGEPIVPHATQFVSMCAGKPVLSTEGATVSESYDLWLITSSGGETFLRRHRIAVGEAWQDRLSIHRLFVGQTSIGATVRLVPISGKVNRRGLQAWNGRTYERGSKVHNCIFAMRPGEGWVLNAHDSWHVL